MSYFNHAFKKMFPATFGDQNAVQGTSASVTAGILTTAGIHVGDLKETAAPFALGPGVMGFFDPETHLSIVPDGEDCCPFYIASAAIKLKDKQGPFHGGYQASNKSKIINPKYIRDLWYVNPNEAHAMVLSIGESPSATNIGGVLTFDNTTLVGGTGYSNAAGVAVTGGTGSDLTVDITVTPTEIATVNILGVGADVSRTPGTYTDVASTTSGSGTGATFDVVVGVGGTVDSVTVNDPGYGYAVADTITISDAVLGSGGGADVTAPIVAVTGTGPVATVAVNDDGYGYVIGDTITITGGGADATIDVLTVSAGDHNCDYLCGKSYYLRIDVKGTAALRFANHNLYRTFEANGGCCDDPANPEAVPDINIYKQWAVGISEDPYLKDFMFALLVVDGQAYAYNAAQATLAGLDPDLYLYENAPTTGTFNSILLYGSYVNTEFADCTFQPSDYYHYEPVQIYASAVDLNGDPCTFCGTHVETLCDWTQPNGLRQQKIREMILSESYLQNFFSSDLRIREITQGTNILDFLTEDFYSSFFILHSVPRFNNPTGVFDNDQYLLEIIGTKDTVDYLNTLFRQYVDTGCMGCKYPTDYTGINDCTYEVPGAN